MCLIYQHHSSEFCEFVFSTGSNTAKQCGLKEIQLNLLLVLEKPSHISIYQVIDTNTHTIFRWQLHTESHFSVIYSCLDFCTPDIITLNTLLSYSSCWMGTFSRKLSILEFFKIILIETRKMVSSISSI